jgi:G3E family GTPase
MRLRACSAGGERNNFMKTRLIVIGGFLGSGKTTLLKEVARRLTQQGKAVGLITNDQAPDLVDTAILTGNGMGVIEVAGSCFCCDFSGFESAIQSLIDRRADIILAEPVGSCTDLVATIMHPIMDRRPDIDLAPLTVLASPDHIREALGKTGSAIHDSAVYILGLQMAESDCLLLNKIDLLNAAERAELAGLLRDAFPAKAIGEISARTGEGIGVWLDAIMAGGEAGKHGIDVDYDRYAEGEAVLGWLNAVIQLESLAGEADFLMPTLALMESLHREFRATNSQIGHLKAIVESGGRQRVANLTNLNGEIVVLDRSPLSGAQARLILNARVQMPAAALETVARQALEGLSGQALRASTTAFRCLTPGRPQPTYRYRD